MDLFDVFEINSFMSLNRATGEKSAQAENAAHLKQWCWEHENPLDE